MCMYCTEQYNHHRIHNKNNKWVFLLMYWILRKCTTYAKLFSISLSLRLNKRVICGNMFERSVTHYSAMMHNLVILPSWVRRARESQNITHSISSLFSPDRPRALKHSYAPVAGTYDGANELKVKDLLLPPLTLDLTPIPKHWGQGIMLLSMYSTRLWLGVV